jgi:hypothetical protein
MAAIVIALLPLIESRIGIAKVLKRIGQRHALVEGVTDYDAYHLVTDSSIYQKGILVPIDGLQ